MLKTESYRRGIVISTLLNIVAKGITFLNALIITFIFGSQVQTDIYFYVIAVVALISGLVNGIDLLVLIPESMRRREQESEESSVQFCNFFLWSYLCIGILACIVSLSFPVSFYKLFSNFDEEKLNTFRYMLNIGSIILLFQLVNSLLSSILSSYKFFTASIFAGLINSLFAIVFTFILHQKFGITGTLFGLLTGYLINFIILVLVMKKKLKWNFFNVKVLRDKPVWKNILLMEINILPTWVQNYLTIFLLSGLGAGMITGLNLAQNIAILPDVFISSQIISIAGIKFSELNAKKDFVQLRIIFTDIFILLLVIIIPIGIVFVLCSPDIISVAYVRGNFTAESAKIANFCFFYLAMLGAFKVADLIFSRLFTALQLYGITVLVAFIAHSLFALLTYLLTTTYGLKGYFWALLLGSYCIVGLAFVIIIRLKARFLASRQLIENLIKLVLITAIVSGIMYEIKEHTHFSSVLNILIISAITAALFWSAAYFFISIDPAKKILNQILQRTKTYMR